MSYMVLRLTSFDVNKRCVRINRKNKLRHLCMVSYQQSHKVGSPSTSSSAAWLPSTYHKLTEVILSIQDYVAEARFAVDVGFLSGFCIEY